MKELLALPPHIRKRLAQALESGSLSQPITETAVQFAVGSSEHSLRIVTGLASLSTLGVSGRAAGAWIRTVDEAVACNPKPDVVWSGPSVQGLFARETRWVFEELLGSAREMVWASTYAFFDGPRAFEILARRMDEIPSLSVRLLLNIQRKRGDASSSEEVIRRFVEHFWKADWPGARPPQVYYDPRSLAMEGPIGVLHAKALVVDHEVSFVSSANMTEAALDRNIELGVLVRDRAFALTIAGYFQALIDQGLLSLLPSG